MTGPTANGAINALASATAVDSPAAQPQGGGTGVPQGIIPPPPPAPNPSNTLRWEPEPASPPTAALDEAGMRRIVEAVTASVLAVGKPRASAGQKARAAIDRVPPRTRRYAGAGAVVVAAGLGWRALMPAPVDTQQVAAIASAAATKQAQSAMASDLARARAETATVVVADAFSWAPLPLTESARTLIGYDATTGFRTLDGARADMVAKQARALLVGVPVTQLRLVAKSPTELRVTTNPAEGVALFETVTPTTAAAPTTTTPHGA